MCIDPPLQAAMIIDPPLQAAMIIDSNKQIEKSIKVVYVGNVKTTFLSF